MISTRVSFGKIVRANRAKIFKLFEMSFPESSFLSPVVRTLRVLRASPSKKANHPFQSHNYRYFKSGEQAPYNPYPSIRQSFEVGLKDSVDCLCISIR